MTKIAEQFIDGEGSTFHIKQTYDFDAGLRKARLWRDRGADDIAPGDGKLIADIPLPLVTHWCQEAGIRFSDTEARRDLVLKKIQSGEADLFRVWGGTF